MMNAHLLSAARRLCSVMAIFVYAMIVSAPSAHAQIALADQPTSQPVVPGNVMLTLSVEYPTAIAVAYPYASGNYTSSACSYGSSSSGSGIPYCNSLTNPYLGYFDPGKCYIYVTTATDPTNGPYFQPYSTTTTQSCTSTSSTPLWSGNWLNWASMSTIDVFRWVLTGGNRVVDTTTTTILQKSWASAQGSTSDYVSGATQQADVVNKSTVLASDIAGATPFKNWSLVNTRVGKLGYVMWVTGSANSIMSYGSHPYVDNNGNVNLSLGLIGAGYGTNKIQNIGQIGTGTMPIAYTGQNSLASSGSSGYADPTQIYALQIRVQVCNSTIGVESNCTYYGASASNYKPEGLMQEYATSIRFGAMGYLNNPPSGQVDTRDGGVLRASMKYVGPTQPNPDAANTTNSLAEWSSVNGIFVTDPSHSDITNSLTSPSPAVTNSGVINYLNQFGQATGNYRGYDPVSELYYASLRYFEHLDSTGAASGTGNTSPAPVPWVTGTTPPYTSGTLTSAEVDGFPVVTQWTDPILYACQANFIVGIGDVNTHSDADIQGSALTDTDDVSAIATDNVLGAISYGGQTGVAAATNMVGALEGLGKLGKTWWQSGDNATYHVAGLAYFAHTNDIRPYDFLTSDNLDSNSKKIYTQTISTYWLDVQEYQQYLVNNQFYLSTKYGGFTIPSGFEPWATTNTNTGYVPQLTTSSGVVNMSNGSWYTNGGTLLGKSSATCDVPTSSAASNDSTNTGSKATCNWQPDNYFSALDARLMVNGLESAFASIANGKTGYGTSFAATSANLTASGSLSYASSYTPAPYWIGDVIGSTATFSSTTGNVTTTQVWDAASILTGSSTTSNNPTAVATSRKIVTCCTSSSPTSGTQTTTPASGSWGLPFNADSLATTTFSRTNYASFAHVPNVATANQSVTAYVNYLRGDRTNEICVATATNTCTTTGFYRTRTSLLGDIVDSQLDAVGAPAAGYANGTNPGYSSFASTYASRKTVVYVGANDGMLHAFDGTSGTTGGSELFAYVPSFVYGCYNTSTCTNTSTPSASNPVISGVNGLASLGNKSFIHHYLVDATPVVVDIDLNNTGGASTGASGYAPNWASVLIGGLGKGGHGYYAIDVTDPASWKDEQTVAGKVLWEFTDSRMGDSYGLPVVAKTVQWGWVVIFTSGYNNVDGNGYFFVVNAATGALIQAIATGASGYSVSNQSGLAHAKGFVNDATNYTMDAVYAGDLLGNLWRLDLTPTTGSYAAPTLIATLTDPSGKAQPVTTDPFIEQEPNTLNRYVFVGTGRLLDPSDAGSTQIQTFYAIRDGKTTPGGFYTTSTLPSGIDFPVTRSVMVANTDLLTGITASSSQPMGWYFDLSTDSSTGIAERIIVDPATYYGVVAFAADLPSGTVCNPSGTSRLFATSFGTGLSVLTSSSTSSTLIAYSTAVSGSITQLQFVNVNNTVFLEAGNNKGQTITPPVSQSAGGNFHRINWREVPTTN